MNKREKGRMLERMVSEMFRRAGWCVHLVQPSMRYSQKLKKYFARPQDIFGADLIAIKPANKVVFCQVTSDKSLKRKVNEFKKYPFPYEIVLRLIFMADKVGGRWVFSVYLVDGSGECERVSRHGLKGIFGKAFDPKKFKENGGEHES